MASCVAYGCGNRNSREAREYSLLQGLEKITFHRFPKEEFRRQKWIAAVRRKNWQPSDYSVLCSAHFTEDCFDRTSLYFVRLGDHAIPTIFPDLPSGLQQKSRKQPLSGSECIARKIYEKKPKIEIVRQCHFEEQEFERHRKDGKKKLLPTALPSIFPTHRIKLPARPSHEHLESAYDPEEEEADEEPQSWQLLDVKEEDSLPSCGSEVDIPVEYLEQALEEGQPSALMDTGDASSSGEASTYEEVSLYDEASSSAETVVMSEGNSKRSSQLYQNGGISPDSGPQAAAGESTALLQRYRQEITLLKQTLHNYKQRAWHVDVVLAALRRENELLRGALQDLSPGRLERVLDQGYS